MKPLKYKEIPSPSTICRFFYIPKHFPSSFMSCRTLSCQGNEAKQLNTSTLRKEISHFVRNDRKEGGNRKRGSRRKGNRKKGGQEKEAGRRIPDSPMEKEQIKQAYRQQ